jgi:hypothetical protein
VPLAGLPLGTVLLQTWSRCAGRDFWPHESCPDWQHATCDGTVGVSRGFRKASILATCLDCGRGRADATADLRPRSVAPIHIDRPRPRLKKLVAGVCQHSDAESCLCNTWSGRPQHHRKFAYLKDFQPQAMQICVNVKPLSVASLTDRRAGPSPEPHSWGWGLPCGPRPCDDSPRRRRAAILTDMLVVRADGFVDPCIPSLAHKPPSGRD